MAMLARAILKELPEYESYWHIPSIRFGKRIMRNTNGLIGRYPDADGMKTGFICASGFNVVASATRNGRKLIVVVFGSRSGMVRSEKAAQLFEKGFASGGLSWLMPSLGTVDALQPIAAAPPNLRDEMCGKNRKRPAAEDDDDDTVQASSDVDQSSAFADDGEQPARAQGDRADPRPAAGVRAGERLYRSGAQRCGDDAACIDQAPQGRRRHRDGREAGRKAQDHECIRGLQSLARDPHAGQHLRAGRSRVEARVGPIQHRGRRKAEACGKEKAPGQKARREEDRRDQERRAEERRDEIHQAMSEAAARRVARFRRFR
jgi:D-alanyl-D-alanine carboxypeptidase